MAGDDSALNAAQLEEARALLSQPRRRERLWPVMVAALALAVASIGFATAMILAPPVVKEHTARTAPGS